MAIALVKNGGVASDKVGGNATLVVTVPAGGHAAGNLLIVISASSVNVIDGTESVTDSRGNTYTAVEYGNTTAPANNCRLFASVLTTALQAGDTITLSGGGGVGTFLKSAITTAEFSGASNVEDIASTFTRNSTGATNPSAGPITPPSARTLVLAAVGPFGPTGDGFTQDSDTAGGSAWTAGAISGTTGGSAATNITVRSAYKITGSSASQTYNPTLGTARPFTVLIAALKEAGPTTWNGAATITLVDARTTAGTRQTFGVVVRSETVTPVTAGVIRQNWTGAATVSLVVQRTTAGIRKLFGAATVPLVVARATNGIRALVASSTTTETVTRTTAGRLTAKAVVARGETVGITTTGDVSGGTTDHFGAAIVQLVNSRTTTGQRKTFSVATVSETVSTTTLARLTIRGTILRGETVTVTTVGAAQGSKIGAAQVQLQATRTTAGRVTLKTASTVALVDTITSAGRRSGTFTGSSTTHATVTVTTTGNRYWLGQSSVAETVTVTTGTSHVLVTLADVLLHIQVTSSATSIEQLPPGTVFGPTTGRITTTTTGQLAAGGVGYIDEPADGILAAADTGLVGVG